MCRHFDVMGIFFLHSGIWELNLGTKQGHRGSRVDQREKGGLPWTVGRTIFLTCRVYFWPKHIWADRHWLVLCPWRWRLSHMPKQYNVHHTSMHDPGTWAIQLPIWGRKPRNTSTWAAKINWFDHIQLNEIYFFLRDVLIRLYNTRS
jgi:hypothetical protein